MWPCSMELVHAVDDTDLASKRAFLLIQMLFQTRLSEATPGVQGAPAPLNEIPVK